MHNFILVFFISSFENIYNGNFHSWKVRMNTQGMYFLFYCLPNASFTMQGFSSLPDLTCNHGDDSLKQKALVLNFNGSDLDDNWILSDIGNKVFDKESFC